MLLRVYLWPCATIESAIHVFLAEVIETANYAHIVGLMTLSKTQLFVRYCESTACRHKRGCSGVQGKFNVMVIVKLAYIKSLNA